MIEENSRAMFTEDQKDLLLELQQAGIVLFQREIIRAKYGLGSPVYLDLRENLYARADLIWRVGGEFVRKINELSSPGDSVQGVVGVPDTATPLAVATALYAWKEEVHPVFRYILLRKEGKAYGSSSVSHIIGSRDSGQCECNLIDDVIASGLSKWKAVQTLADEGIEVKRIIVFMDRQQGGSELLASEGHQVQSVFKLLDVVDFYLEQGTIGREQHRRVSDFIRTRRFEEPFWS
jgi:orotate phosphoribosyltransferase